MEGNDGDKGNEGEKKQPCTFFKSSGRKANIRKRKSDSFATEDDSSTEIVRKDKMTVGAPLVQSTKDVKRTKEDFSQESSKSAVPVHPDQLATATIEWNPEVDESKRAASRASAIKVGPTRAATHHRAISYMDYQPDVCKDYKETGYCGFGDSCKFLHDRGDYKSSFELEKEWEAEQKLKKKMRLEAPSSETNNEEDEDNVPFACPVCRNPFVDPVVSKCKHYFCEKCALQLNKCEICGENTNRAFRTVTPAERKKLERALERHQEQS